MTVPSEPLVCMVVYTKYATDARVRREAETLAAHGFRVVCLTNRDGSEARRYELAGVEVRELGVPKYRGKNAAAYVGSYLRFLCAASAACLRLQRQERVAVVHAHNLPDFLVFAGALPRLSGTKIVLDVHDSIPETFASKFSDGALGWKALCLEERLSASLANRVICVNHPQRDTLVTRGVPFSKTFISMNVPDPRVFGDAKRDAPAYRSGRLNLVYHGTMAARLGVDLLISAVSRVRSAGVDVQLHLWGAGDDLGGFRRLADELNLTGSVHFNPQGYPLEELPKRLESMDIGLVGNRRTAAGELMLPVKLLEYVALGIPVIAPRLRTISYYFPDAAVSYYEPDDVDSLAEAICSLHGRPGDRRERANRAQAFLRENGWHRQGSEFLSLYRGLTGRNG